METNHNHRPRKLSACHLTMGEEKPSIALALTERAQKDNIAIRQKSEDLDKNLQEKLLQLRPRQSLRGVPATPAPAIAPRGAIRSELNIQILDSTSAERLTLYLKSELAVFLESPNPEGFVGLIIHLFGWNTDFLGRGTSKVAALLAGDGIVIRPTLAGDEIHAIPDDMLDWQSEEIYHEQVAHPSEGCLETFGSQRGPIRSHHN